MNWETLPLKRVKLLVLLVKWSGRTWKGQIGNQVGTQATTSWTTHLQRCSSTCPCLFPVLYSLQNCICLLFEIVVYFRLRNDSSAVSIVADFHRFCTAWSCHRHAHAFPLFISLQSLPDTSCRVCCGEHENLAGHYDSGRCGHGSNRALGASYLSEGRGNFFEQIHDNSTWSKCEQSNYVSRLFGNFCRNSRDWLFQNLRVSWSGHRILFSAGCHLGISSIEL